MRDYVVSITFFDEISTFTLTASSPEEAIEGAKLAIERLARGRSSDWRWPASEIESYIAGYRSYDYSASLASEAEKWVGREVIESWREPALPSACPNYY